MTSNQEEHAGRCPKFNLPKVVLCKSVVDNLYKHKICSTNVEEVPLMTKFAPVFVQIASCSRLSLAFCAVGLQSLVTSNFGRIQFFVL